MIARILLGAAIGIAFGALLGSTRSCADGGCPLTANWKRGAVWGGALGILFAMSLGPPAARTSAPPSPATPAPETQRDVPPPPADSDSHQSQEG